MDSVSKILKDAEFKFNKQFGQNFITDTNLLDAIVADSGITSDDIVIEIGPGAGTLTRAIAKVAKKVIAYEIDKSLQPILAQTLQGYDDVVQVVYKDIMKVSDEEINSVVGGTYKVVANLPYYITTPILMRFVESEYPPQSLSIMVQKEVAERIAASPNTAEYGAISAVIALHANVTITRIVGRNMFYPSPKVDSAVIKLDIDNDKYNCNKSSVKKIIKAAFAMRRKTLINNLLLLNIERTVIEKAISELNYDVRVRGEVLGVEDFIYLSKVLLKGEL